MQVHKFTNLSPALLIIFVVTICVFGISASNVQAATFIVDTLADDATKTACTAAANNCSLRGAIIRANANPDPDDIDFSVTGEILLNANGSLPEITTQISVNGPGAKRLVIRRDSTAAAAFRIISVSSSGFLVLSDISITGGLLPSGAMPPSSGGGISNQGFLLLTHSSVSGNRADVGGGIVNLPGALLNVDTSTISNNHASLIDAGLDSGGGGILNLSSLLVKTSTISGNEAARGGGIHNLSYAQISNATVTNNHASVSGGGIFQTLEPTGQIVLTSSLIAANSGGSGKDIFGVVAYAEYSLTGDTSDPLTGISNIEGADPMLGPLQYNGGQTKTHALLPGSPAINTGNSRDFDDQRGPGYDRGVGAGVDIGAFEIQPTCAGISFAAPSSFGTGDSPMSVITADLNGDDKLDLATANDHSNNVSVHLGDGLGGFGPPTNVPAGLWATAVTASDFNGDGKLDLATANNAANSVSLLIGNGLGGFAPAVNFPTDSGPRSLISGDLNGDGNADIAVGNFTSDNISVLLGDGMGGFGTPTNFATGDGPIFIIQTDLNSDGNIDLVTPNLFTNTVSVLLGNGTGSFAPATNFAVNGFVPEAVTAGDFNSDGKTDIATANGVGGDISVLIGNGDGTLAPATTVFVFERPRSILPGDFNGDGKLDLAVTRYNTDEVLILVGDGAGGFTPSAPFPAADAPRSLVAGDFNADGRLDLVVSNEFADALSVLLNSCLPNPAPVAHYDSYTMNEGETLNASSVLVNDTAFGGAPLTAAVWLDPGSVADSFTFNADGTFTFVPIANFTGEVTFYYRANDGSRNSNTAQVAIMVNRVNDAPTLSASPETQSVQYSDSIATVAISGSDVETPAAALTIAFSYSKDGAASVAGLPTGMTQGGTGGAWTVSGKANVPAGSYVITASVTDAGDSPSPPITSTDTFTIAVTRENAVAVPRLNNPVAMQVGSGGTATGSTGEFCFDFAEVADGSPGNISLIDSASVQINAVGGGSVSSITPSWITFSSMGPRVACVLLHLAGTAPNVFEVTLNIGGGYYTGSGTTAFLVYDPSAGFASGGGWIINPNTGYRANYGVNVKYLKNGNAQGSILYIEHRPDGDYKFKSTSLNSSGGFAIVPITGGAEAQIAGKGNYGLNGVFNGNYSFIARVIDKGNPGTNDSFGLKLITPNGQVMNEFTFNPQLLGGGNNQVPKK